MNRDKFLASVKDRVEGKGHTLRAWVKGRWGFHTWCMGCGAFVSVTVRRAEVREEPADTCAERLESLR